MASRNSSFSKFTLKPSSLSQLTVNFNKKLEDVPAPKIDPNDLVGKPDHQSPISNQENINRDEAVDKKSHPPAAENTTGNKEYFLHKCFHFVLSKLSRFETPTRGGTSKEFVFGENITERVVNASTSEGADGEASETSSQAKEKPEGGEKTAASSSIPTSSSTNNVSWLNDAESAEKYASALQESDFNSLCKINCKLYVLEADKANWAERGYGILKVIDMPDGNNCKIMMWTDKCYRLILNTKLFENMKIDLANKKSLRLNAFDNGTIRIFLIKAQNQNDCDELYSVLNDRLRMFNASAAKAATTLSSCQDESQSNLSSSEASGNRKITKFKCDCTVSRESNPSLAIRAKIHLYSLEIASTSADSVASPPMLTNSHQLFLEIHEANDSEPKINLNSYLKLVKIRKHKLNASGKHSRRFLEFEVVDLAQTKSNIKYKVCLNDRESAAQFLSLYKKEPKFTSPDDSSSNGTSAFDKDLDEFQDGDLDSADGSGNDVGEDEDERSRSSTSSSSNSASSEGDGGVEADESSFQATGGDESLETGESPNEKIIGLKRKSETCDDELPLSLKKQELGGQNEESENTKKAGVGGTKRNLDESGQSECDSTTLKESLGEGTAMTSGMKKSKVCTDEASEDDAKL